MLLYLASGTINHGDRQAGFTAYESEFARDAKERAERERSIHGWKAKRNDNAPMWSRSVVWGSQSEVPEHKLMAIGHLSRGFTTDEIIYSLRMRGASGLFKYSFTTREEYRFFHRNDFVEHGFSADPTDRRIAIAIQDDDGSSHLHLLDASGKDCGPITAGDAIDAFPAFHPNGKSLLYQSIGIGRNAQGVVAGHGPAVIHRLDPNSGCSETVLDDPRFDFLKPVPCADGSILCIRRPHQPVGHYSSLTALKDLLFFPVRLGHAVFGFLNVFSIMFGNRPLSSNGGPQTLPIPESRVFLYGRLIDAKKAMEESARSPEGQSMVPASWTLIRHRKGVGDEVLASHVASFTVDPTGDILVTNGFSIRKPGNNTQEPLARDVLIEDVLTL